MDLANAVTATATSFRVLMDIVEANKSLAHFNEILTATYDANTKLMTMMAVTMESKEKELMLSNRVRELEEENVKLKNWDREREQYSLVEVTPGFFAHRRKPEIETSEPVHYLCTNCFDQGKKSILQFERIMSARSYRCLRCASKVNV